VTVALDATPLTVPTGGVARYTLSLALALAENYPEDQYWLLSDQPFPSPGRALRNLHSFSSTRPGGAATGMARRWWLWGLPRKLAELRVQMFHGTDFSVPYLPLRPSVMTLHDLSPWLDPSWQPAAHRVRRRTPFLLRSGLCTMVITPSDAVRRAAIERFQLSSERVVTIPLAAGANFRPVPPRSPTATPYFLYAGTLEPRKNLGRLVEAWREIRKTAPVDLILAGRVRSDFTPPAPEPGLRILGPVDEQELPALYSGAVACVYPSLYEGFGLPVLEAMQCRALLITSRDPAIQEITGGASGGTAAGTAGGAAIQVDALDTRALANALHAALHQPQNFNGVRDRALTRAADFSWKRTAQRTREVYEAARRAFE
jgi:glycosyltransferase involved in cell wall biosynthesis